MQHLIKLHLFVKQFVQLSDVSSQIFDYVVFGRCDG